MSSAVAAIGGVVGQAELDVMGDALVLRLDVDADVLGGVAVAVGDDVRDLDEGGRLLERGDEEHVGAGALGGELPRRVAAAGESGSDVAGGCAGDGRLQRQAELAGQRLGVLLLDRDALGGEVLAAAEAEDERPRGQSVGIDAPRRAAASSRAR